LRAFRAHDVLLATAARLRLTPPVIQRLETLLERRHVSGMTHGETSLTIFSQTAIDLAAAGNRGGGHDQKAQKRQPSWPTRPDVKGLPAGQDIFLNDPISPFCFRNETL
jgi:hypothetical protein